MTVREIVDRHPQLEEALRTFYHALPELLADPTAGKFVVVMGKELYGRWDTDRDAYQHAAGRFETGTFLVQPVDARLLDLFADAFGPLPAEAAPCPA